MDTKTALLEKINQSSLSFVDKKEWEEIVNNSPNYVLGEFLGFIEKFPAELPWLNEIYKKKREAFAVLKTDEAKGQSMLGEIYEEEKNRLTLLLAS